MQKLRVKISLELEIPDDWKVLSPSEDGTPHIMINGRFFEPDLIWMEYKGIGPEGFETWEGADDEINQLISEHTPYGVECSIRRIRRLSSEGKQV
jgi:hypothetical protein